jgi:3-phosphoshikimate 1-carboxyvinyltransferase
VEKLRVKGGAKGVRGVLSIPGDKSISHRALIVGALSEGVTEVTGCLRSDDCQRTTHILQALGVTVEGWDGEPVRIHGKGRDGLREAEEVLDCRNSGTTLRLLTGVLSGQPFLSVLTGDASLRRRPMDRVVLPLREMGAKIWGRAKDTLPPLAIRGGKLQGITYRSPLASAQVKSAILLAGLFADGPATVIEPHVSRDHTERMLQAAGQSIHREGSMVTLTPTGPLRAQRISVPGDFSSAAFFLVAGLILPDADLTVKGVGINPTRTGLLEVLQAMGGSVEVLQREESTGEPRASLRVRSSPLRCVELGGDLIPRLIDEIPVLAVTAAVADGKTVIRDAAELRVKESDRIVAIARELKKMGVRVEELSDGLIIHGRGVLQGAAVESYGDHRMAMALAIAGLKAVGTTTVVDTECIHTSFPGFVTILRDLIPGAVEYER